MNGWMGERRMVGQDAYCWKVSSGPCINDSRIAWDQEGLAVTAGDMIFLGLEPDDWGGGYRVC